MTLLAFAPPHTGPVAVYLTVRTLPRAGSCLLVRQPGKTLIAVDPRQTRQDVALWCFDNLTEQEQDAYRSAWDLAPVGCPLPEWVVEDGPCLLFVPRSIRLRGAPAFQGGSELVRRRREGSLMLERELYRAELARARRQVASA